MGKAANYAGSNLIASREIGFKNCHQSKQNVPREKGDLYPWGVIPSSLLVEAGGGAVVREGRCGTTSVDLLLQTWWAPLTRLRLGAQPRAWLLQRKGALRRCSPVCTAPNPPHFRGAERSKANSVWMDAGSSILSPAKFGLCC